MGVDRARSTFDLADRELAPVAGRGRCRSRSSSTTRWRCAPSWRRSQRQRRAQELTIAALRGGYRTVAERDGQRAPNRRRARRLVPDWSRPVLDVAVFQGGLTKGQVHEAKANLSTLARAGRQPSASRARRRRAGAAGRAGRQGRPSAPSQDALVNAREQLRLAEGRYAQGLGSVIELGDAQLAVTAAARKTSRRSSIYRRHGRSSCPPWGSMMHDEQRHHGSRSALPDAPTCATEHDRRAASCAGARHRAPASASAAGWRAGSSARAPVEDARPRPTASGRRAADADRGRGGSCDPGAGGRRAARRARHPRGLGTVAASRPSPSARRSTAGSTRCSSTKGRRSRRATCSRRSIRARSTIQLHTARGRARARQGAAPRTRKLNLERYKTLREQNLDPAAAGRRSARRWSISSTAPMQADQAQIESARLKLDYARITSPIDGVTGVRLVDPGNLVHASDATGIVVVTAARSDRGALHAAAGRSAARRRSAGRRATSPVEALQPRRRQQARQRASSRSSTTRSTRRRRRSGSRRSSRTREHALWPNAVRQGAPARRRREGRARRARRRSCSAARRARSSTSSAPTRRRRCAPIEVDAIAGRPRDHREGPRRRRAGRRRRAEPAPAGQQGRVAAAERRGSRGARRGTGGAERAARRAPRPRGSSEHLRAVHPAAGRDDAADDRPAARGHRRLSRSCRSRRCRRSTTRRSSSRRTCPGASAETMASAVTTPLERQFGQMPSLAQMTSVSSFGSSQITLQFTLDRNIDAAEQDVQAAINAASNLLPRTLPAPPTYSKSNPADTPILTLAVSSRHAAARAGRRLRRLDPRAEDLAGLRRRPRDAQRRAEAGGARAGRSARRSPARASRSRTCAPRSSPRTSTSRRATSTAPRQDYTLATNDQLVKADGVQAARPRLQERRAGAARATSPTSIDGVENAQLAGWAERRSARSSSTCSASRARTSSRSPTASRRCCRSSRRRCRRASTSTILSDRTETVRASVEDVRVHAGPHHRPRRRGHLRLPAQRARDDHPRRRRAALARRHVRRDVPARLQPQQPVADGAHHLDRLRRRRRDRDDREHRALHRGGRAAVRGGAQGRASRSASPSCRSRCRWSRCSSRCSSWAASSAGSSASSRSRSRSPSASRRCSR